MKKMMVLLAGAVLLLTQNTAVNAYTIDYSHATTGSEFTSNYSSTLNDFKLLTFDGTTPGNVNSSSTKSDLPWTWTGTATVVNGSATGLYAAPFGAGTADTSNFLAVPNPTANGSVRVQLGALYNYFGLWWGSVDSYNTLSFYNGDMLVASFTGADAISASVANGNQTASSTNLYVNFLDLPLFDRFVMGSTNFAFEADNIAIGNSALPVPEPGTMVLLGIGLFAVATCCKRRMNHLEA
ncbi:PEP-CTERM sorting domain-containing protein [Geobacter sp. AOG2]|uniref:PEP-CTERM sorting domain-containing protein n=1 Tax=Geobacter sp. AOG2 TaxID=1566347 RepID=UPI001CC3E7ED|nr:PEP-CTERM sorting domain-containing protein [Geobacter sp. AOG2]GFE60653.1 hypothetical protein AOG2_12410 [Geobacter sp. AOG2]